MKPERTIQELYDNWHYKSRQGALNYLLCTLGNGYEWKEGELVDSALLYGYDSIADELIELPFKKTQILTLFLKHL